MKRLSIVLIGLLCVLAGCGNQNKASTELETTPSGMVDASQKATDGLTERITELVNTVQPDEMDGVADGISRTKEKGEKYTVFNCDGELLGSKDDENTWWPLIVNDTVGFNNLEDGDFAYCSLNTRVEDGGIAGIHEIIVEKVNSCGRCMLEDVKQNKGDLLMSYDFEHPYVAGLVVYADYVIVQINYESYYVYQNGAFVDKFDNLEDVTLLLQGQSVVDKSTPIDEETKELYKQYVSDSIAEVFDSEDFVNSEEETRIFLMLECMKTLKEKGYIKDYTVPDNDVISYVDLDGIENGVKVMPFEEGIN